MPEMPALCLQLVFAGSVFYVASDNGRNLKTVRFSMDGRNY